VDKVHQGRL